MLCVAHEYGIRKRERPEPDRDPGLEGRIGRSVNARTNKEEQDEEDCTNQATDAPCKCMFWYVLYRLAKKK